MDLEERNGKPKQFKHGPLGKPVREMDWEEICLWLEEMGARDHVIEFQRERQLSGTDVEQIIQKPWKFAIEEVRFLAYPIWTFHMI